MYGQISHQQFVLPQPGTGLASFFTLALTFSTCIAPAKCYKMNSYVEIVRFSSFENSSSQSIVVWLICWAVEKFGIHFECEYHARCLRWLLMSFQSIKSFLIIVWKHRRKSYRKHKHNVLKLPLSNVIYEYWKIFPKCNFNLNFNYNRKRPLNNKYLHNYFIQQQYFHFENRISLAHSGGWFRIIVHPLKLESSIEGENGWE